LWGEERLEWPRAYLELPHGIASHNTIGRIFGLVDRYGFESAFRRWVGSILPALGAETVAIDGKSSRRSGGVDAMGTQTAIAAKSDRYRQELFGLK
jgi:hypothetical protein